MRSSVNGTSKALLGRINLVGVAVDGVDKVKDVAVAEEETVLGVGAEVEQVLERVVLEHRDFLGLNTNNSRRRCLGVQLGRGRCVRRGLLAPR